MRQIFLGPESDKFGLANVSWLTGTAAWMYIAVTQYMLGIRAKWYGLEIDPCFRRTSSGESTKFSEEKNIILQ